MALKKILKKPFKTLLQRGYYLNHNILLEPYYAIYFFIPKVACSSIKQACADALGFSVKNVHDFSYPFIRTKDIEKYQSYFKFAFVRNPWDRVASLYRERILSSEQTNKLFKKGVMRNLASYGVFRAGMSFDEFVDALVKIPDENADPHFRSQYTFISDKDGKLFVDFIGKFENLENDFGYVVKKINLPGKLPHLNPTKMEKPYVEYYSKHSREQIRRRYAEDIDLFNYSFDSV